MPITDQQLISQYQQIHSSKVYGQTSSEFVLEIQCCLLDLKPKSVLEYGCGQSLLEKQLQLDSVVWSKYDPAITEYSEIIITKCDLVINTDVMEHIPESDIDDVLSHIKSFSDKVFFHISTRLAYEILPNGDNAHCTVWPAQKWLEKIRNFFPHAVLAYSIESNSCIILTWDSSVKNVLSQILDLRMKNLYLENSQKKI